MPEKNLPVGSRFGKLQIIGYSAPVIRPNGRYSTMSLCLCDCGNVKAIRNYSIRNGSVKACGFCRTPHIKHGHTRSNGGQPSPEYHVWVQMKERCRNPKSPKFKHYGGRGISVCEKWRDSFAAFLKDMGQRPTGTSLDRYPDPNGNYEPGNCRWATRFEQARNTVRTDIRTVSGVTACLKDLCKHFGVSYGSVYGRVKYKGWPADRAIAAAPKFNW